MIATQDPNQGDSPNKSAGRALPRFQCTKVVEAFKILDIDYGRALLYAEEFTEPFQPKPEWWVNTQPVVGGYFVRYADGYQSYSPAKAFEEGYVSEADWGVPLEQEGKYTVNGQGRIINRTTGKPIPENEPVMMFRGQDAKATTALWAYYDACTSPDHRAVIKARIHQFEEFARARPEYMKEPDSNMRELAAVDVRLSAVTIRPGDVVDAEVPRG